MIRVIRVCRKCGAKILSDAPKGLCTACVLENALGISPDVSVAEIDLSTVASAKADDSANVDELSPNDATALSDNKKTACAAAMLGELGDYELLEEIGRGGQGVVFRARQRSLNRTVALKVISLGQWASKAHLKRFRLEAEAAAHLEHPGIVPIHEVGERDGSCYFSMKFIEGGQLDEVARRAPMSIRQAAELTAKVARIVHYAHEHGILHRDIKPGNILLDAKGEPHLTDFGLARLVESESSVTHTLDVLGTPSYMAPEQAMGNNAAISSTTDVYGLGAVLYQLLTGQPPFAGGATYETIKLLLDTEPRPPRLLNPKIDRDLSTISLKCLEKDPKRRYPSALALAEDLDRWLKHEPIQARRIGLSTRGKKWVRRNPSVAVMAAMLLALTVPLGVSIWKNEFIAHPVTNGVAVLPFENLSGDSDNAYFASGIQDEILTRLASIGGLRVISRTSTQRYQSKPRNLEDIAKQLGVAHILEGSVQKVADQVRVNVQLINAQTDSHLWAETYDRKLTNIFGVESEIAKGIAKSLQAKLSDREEQALAVKPTKNPEAYDAYLRGLAFESRFGTPRELYIKAMSFYEQAVQLDPKFAVAWARLSRLDAWFYFNRFDTTTARRADAAKNSLENAQKLEPSSPETLLALGYYQYMVLLDYETAKNTFESVRRMLPGSSEARIALGLISRRVGQWDQSIAYFEQALALDPGNLNLLDIAAGNYAILRQFAPALKLYDRALDIMPNDPELMACKAGLYQAQGNLREAANLLTEINPQTANGYAFYIKIKQLRLERNYAEGIRLLQAKLDHFNYDSEFNRGDDLLALALMQRVSGDTAGAGMAAKQAINTLEQLYRNQPDGAFIAATLSQAYAVIEEKDSAAKLAERAIQLLPSTKNPMAGPGLEQNLALIQTIIGENSHAISILTQLLRTPYSGWLYRNPVTPALLRLDPIWDPLRGDPAFQKLCDEKQK